jgi:hypothetical protein
MARGIQTGIEVGLRLLNGGDLEGLSMDGGCYKEEMIIQRESEET